MDSSHKNGAGSAWLQVMICLIAAVANFRAPYRAAASDN
jgi:hypothetical protein